MAIHPDQVSVINAAFTPAPQDVERAVRILALFAGCRPRRTGVLSLDGKMIDKPHLRQAERVKPDGPDWIRTPCPAAVDHAFPKRVSALGQVGRRIWNGWDPSQ